MSEIIASYWSHLNIRSQAGATFRSRCAWWVRRLASRIDGEYGFTVTMESSHDVPREDRTACLVAGFTLAKKLYEERVLHEAIEEVMADVYPELQEDDNDDC
ncbi:hypothetical protein [Marinobacter sp.]|uniref:hypothetical protein n=1 Tax=Marinobacter sp. TaxID=50741 RepID=UPI003A91D73F